MLTGITTAVAHSFGMAFSGEMYVAVENQKICFLKPWQKYEKIKKYTGLFYKKSPGITGAY